MLSIYRIIEIFYTYCFHTKSLKSVMYPALMAHLSFDFSHVSSVFNCHTG